MVMNRLLACIFLCSLYFGWGQQESPSESLMIESFGYPDFGDNSSYGEFQVLYPLGEKTSVGVWGLNQQNAAFRRFNARFIIKQRLARRILGTAGYETEWDLTSPDWKQDANKSLYIGIEYEPKPNLSINAGIRNLLNQSGFNPLGAEKSNTRAQWSVGSKLKF